jgi:hypothetical protein
MAYKAPTTLAGWLAIAPSNGLNALNNVPSSMWQQALTVANRHVPTGFSNPSGWVVLCQAMLIARGLVYFKNNPGDCGTPAPISFNSADATQIAGGVASGIAAMAGAALPGIGIAVQTVTLIFQHHDQAVQTEQDTICQVAGVINQVIPYYDSLVAQGKLSPSDAYTGMQSYIAQVTAQLATIQKVCDAACVYSAILSAHGDFCTYYYPAIAPVQASAHAPGAAPSSTGTTPGGVIVVGSSSSGGGALGQPSSPTNQPTSTLADAQTVGTGFSGTEILVFVVAGLLAIFLLFSEAL